MKGGETQMMQEQFREGKVMTQEEFDKIPEMPLAEVKAMWREENEPAEWRGADGRVWEIGWLNGVRYKRWVPL